MSNFSIRINPVALAVHVILGGLLMLFILRESGGRANLWYGHRPVTWFVLAVTIPELALILIAVNYAAERKSKREAQHTGP